MKQKSAVEAFIHYESRKWEKFQLSQDFDAQTTSLFREYIDFLIPDLTLADYVPCRKVISINIPIGVVKYIPLEKPDVDMDDLATLREAKEYQQALDRVVYEGWEYYSTNDDGKMFIFHEGSQNYLHVFPSGQLWLGDAIKTREDMEGFELRDEVAKELNLI